MMNKEYIEREATLNAMMKAQRERTWSMDDADVIEQMETNVEELPAADVSPVVHGEWIPIVNHFHGKPDGRYYCSVCHRVETMKSIYCRLCGALMDGGKKI